VVVCEGVVVVVWEGVVVVVWEGVVVVPVTLGVPVVAEPVPVTDPVPCVTPGVPVVAVPPGVVEVVPVCVPLVPVAPVVLVPVVCAAATPIASAIANDASSVLCISDSSSIHLLAAESPIRGRCLFKFSLFKMRWRIRGDGVRSLGAPKTFRNLAKYPEW
jgi:hypothetical protein